VVPISSSQQRLDGLEKNIKVKRAISAERKRGSGSCPELTSIQEESRRRDAFFAGSTLRKGSNASPISQSEAENKEIWLQVRNEAPSLFSRRDANDLTGDLLPRDCSEQSRKSRITLHKQNFLPWLAVCSSGWDTIRFHDLFPSFIHRRRTAMGVASRQVFHQRPEDPW
jgi:hypothetical protein